MQRSFIATELRQRQITCNLGENDSENARNQLF